MEPSSRPYRSSPSFFSSTAFGCGCIMVRIRKPVLSAELYLISPLREESNAPPSRVEVQRWRRWPAAKKIRLIEETMQPGMSVSCVARRAGVAPSLLFNWRRRMLEGGLQASS
jgi:Transposase